MMILKKNIYIHIVNMYINTIIFIVIVILSYYLISVYSIINTNNISKSIIGGSINIIQSIFGSYRSKIIDNFTNIISTKGKIIETINDINHKMIYSSTKDNKLSKYAYHIGQRKLFLTELQFLNKASIIKVNYCIYAGSAPKHTMLYLSQLFPNIKFILIDPNKFNIVIPNHDTHRFIKHKDIVHLKSGYPAKCNIINNKDYVDAIENTNYKIYIIEDYMTSDLSHILKKINGICCFISDIRSNIFEGQVPSDFDIIWNNCMMYNWMNILKPIRSMVKYRPLYNENNIKLSNDIKVLDDFKEAKTYGIDFIGDIKKHITIYSKSTIYIQAWAGQTSSEVRLWIEQKDINNLVKYDNIDMEQKMFYFNTIDRNWIYHPNKNANKKIKFCNCNDCSLENKIWEEYGFNSKQILDAVVHLGTITNRKLKDVHKFDYYKIFDKESIQERIDLYIKKTPTKKLKFGFQKGNLGKV
jgi:hypothetical protein